MIEDACPVWRCCGHADGLNLDQKLAEHKAATAALKAILDDRDNGMADTLIVLGWRPPSG